MIHLDQSSIGIMFRNGLFGTDFEWLFFEEKHTRNILFIEHKKCHYTIAITLKILIKSFLYLIHYTL